MAVSSSQDIVGKRTEPDAACGGGDEFGRSVIGAATSVWVSCAVEVSAVSATSEKAIQVAL